MAVVIRLRREGKKKQPFYRIVATDSKFPRDGRFLEILGQYNPLPNEETLSIHEERLIHWMRNGARPSNTVKTLFTRKGLWKNFLEAIKPLPVETAEEEPIASPDSETEAKPEKSEMATKKEDE